MLPAGVIVRPSPYPVKETMDRIQQFLVSHGVTVYARINQQTEVQAVGLGLRPLEFILFGNPKAGHGVEPAGGARPSAKGRGLGR
jgi:uncharacterized protein (DUF302 family)